jgi:hypothetical protein
MMPGPVPVLLNWSPVFIRHILHQKMKSMDYVNAFFGLCIPIKKSP